MYRWNMGPRGRMFGHRGFRPGIFLGILGLIFFGWIIIAAVGGLIGAGIMVLCSVIRSLAHIVPRLITGILSTKGFAIGVALGLMYYFRNHRKHSAEKTEADCENSGTVDGAAVETEIIEEPACRTFGA